MSQTIQIVIIEFLLFLSLSLLVIIVLNWRQNQRRHKVLEHLIEDINNQRGLRYRKILNSLTGKYQLDDLTAEELATLLYNAERQFLYTYIEQQMHNSVQGFYENLAVLLDNFLNAIPVTANKNQYDVLDQVQPSDTIEKARIPDQPIPDWGDVFD